MQSDHNHRDFWEDEVGCDTLYYESPFSSGFTAVNQHADLAPKSGPSVITPSSQETQKRKANRSTKRRRNPNIAQYLGLGRRAEPSHLEKYAPLSVTPPDSQSEHKATPKRRKLIEDNAEARRREVVAVVEMRDHVNEAALHPRSVELTPGLSPNHTLRSTPFIAHLSTPSTQCFNPNDISQHKRIDIFEESNHGCLRGLSHATRTISRRMPQNAVEDNGDDHDDDVILQSGDELLFDEEDFDDDLMDEDFLTLISTVPDLSTSICTSPESPSKPKVPEVLTARLQNKDVPGCQRVLKEFISPVTFATRCLAGASQENAADARQPIVRSPFPTMVRDRSPIIGLSSGGLLRTCFRIGELINQAHLNSKTGNIVTFELYARVLQSKREATRQTFTLCDLFHTKAPHIAATYHASIWRSVELFEYDSKRLLRQGSMCRCMGRLKREGKGWSLTVINIWEATWDDIRWVKGIVNA